MIRTRLPDPDQAESRRPVAPRGTSTSGAAAPPASSHADRLAPRVFHQRMIAQQIADAQRRQARLPRAEEIARPAQREVALGNHEAVGRLDERVEARPRRPR